MRQGASLDVDVVRRAERFARLRVTTAEGQSVDMDLAVDWRESEPVTLSIGPVLSLADTLGIFERLGVVPAGLCYEWKGTASTSSTRRLRCDVATLPSAPTQVGRTVALTAWRSWATRHRVWAALLAGLVAVHIGTVVGFWLGDFGLTRLDWPTANGLVYVPDASPVAQFLIGGLSHYLDGILFALVYAIALAPFLPFGSTAVGNLAKGLVFGTILAVLALLIMTPLVYAPARGSEAGFFSHNFGWSYIVGVFIFHWVYGLHLGLIYNPDDSVSPAESSGTGVK